MSDLDIRPADIDLRFQPSQGVGTACGNTPRPRGSPEAELVPASTAPSFAFLGSLLAHAAIATALVGMGSVHSSKKVTSTDSFIELDAIETPQPIQAPELEPAALVPPPPAERRSARRRSEPQAEPAKAQEPEPQPLAAAAEPAPVQPMMPVATVDARAPSAATIAVPVSAPGSRPTGPGVIAARAPATVRGPLASGAINIDRSRRAGLADGARWDCPFPSEAESEGIERAKAVLRVEIDALGQPQKVTVTQDPGHGFGREARRCAMRRRWMSRLDRAGAPAADSVTVVVSFERS